MGKRTRSSAHACIEDAIVAWDSTQEPQLFSHGLPEISVPESGWYDHAIDQPISYHHVTQKVKEPGLFYAECLDEGDRGKHLLVAVEKHHVKQATFMFGSRGSATGLHVDYNKRGFSYIAVVHGEKAIDLLPPDDLQPFLRDNDVASCDGTVYTFDPTCCRLLVLPARDTARPTSAVSRWWKFAVPPRRPGS